MKPSSGLTPVTKRRGRTPRAITLLASGYEILRAVKGGGLPVDADALIGKPGPPFVHGWLMRRETFNEYRGNGWIKKSPPYVSKGWQGWRITDAGRAEAKARPNPTRAELAAANAASRGE